MLVATKINRIKTQKIAIFGLLILSLAIGFFYAPAAAYAQLDITDTAEQVGEATGLTREPLSLVIGRIIRVILSFLGVVAVIIVIYAGFLYMTAGGNEEQVGKAKKWLINGAIGLVIILSAYAITSYIISKLMQAMGMARPGETAAVYQVPGLGSSALGQVIQDVFPSNGMIVPRNTVIMVTFIDAIEPFSVLADDAARQCVNADNQACTPAGGVDLNCVCRGNLNPEAIKVYRACDSIYPAGAIPPDQYSEDNRQNHLICNDWLGSPPDDDDLFVKQGDVFITPDFKTIIFNPYGNDPDNHLGSPLNDTAYLVQLTNNIRGLGRTAGVFSSQLTDSFSWTFTTNTTIDLTPPFVAGVYPVTLDDNGQPLPADAANANKFPRNTRIRIDFSEPVIPPIYLNQAGGTAGAGAELAVQVGPDLAAGSFVVGLNQYRSVIFKPSGSCGGVNAVILNSCGDQVFCLPADSRITSVARSVPVANLLQGIGPSAANFPAGGIVDAALNALDTDGRLGRGNGATTGAADNFTWEFITANDLDLVGPWINYDSQYPSPASPAGQSLVGLTPSIGADSSMGVKPDSLVSAHFSEQIDPSTAVNKNLSIISDRWDRWYTGGLYCPRQTAADGSSFCITNGTVAVINHADLTSALTPDDVPLFFPKIKSGLQDMAGNCFNPAQGPGCENVGAGQACCAIYDSGAGYGAMQPQTDAGGKFLDACAY